MALLPLSQQEYHPQRHKNNLATTSPNTSTETLTSRCGCTQIWLRVFFSTSVETDQHLYIRTRARSAFLTGNLKACRLAVPSHHRSEWADAETFHLNHRLGLHPSRRLLQQLLRLLECLFVPFSVRKERLVARSLVAGLLAQAAPRNSNQHLCRAAR